MGALRLKTLVALGTRLLRFHRQEEHRCSQGMEQEPFLAVQALRPSDWHHVVVLRLT